MYRPRNARASALYQCANRHMEELRSEGRLQRLIEERVIERFLECGDPHHGFARIYCPIPFRGTATRRETEELLDEGIAVMSLPVPPQSDWH